MTVDDPMADRTLYLVTDINSYGTGWTAQARMGKSYADGSLQLQMDTAGSSNMVARFDTKNGASNNALNFAHPGPRRTIAWAQVASGMTQGRAGYIDKTWTYFQALNAGEGMTTGNLYLSPGSADQIPLCAVAYLGAHDATTRARIIRWLAQRYQIPM